LAGGWCWFVQREKYGWLVVGGWFILREKYCWLVADKSSEQGRMSMNASPSFPTCFCPFVLQLIWSTCISSYLWNARIDDEQSTTDGVLKIEIISIATLVYIVYIYIVLYIMASWGHLVRGMWWWSKIYKAEHKALALFWSKFVDFFEGKSKFVVWEMTFHITSGISSCQSNVNRRRMSSWIE
jgi:hypothetical protein